jgi:hypothetical protein
METDGERNMIEKHNREQNNVVQNQRDKEERNGRASPSSSSQSIIGTERERRKDE